MAVDLKSLKNHPGANPEYHEAMIARTAAQNFNRDQKNAALLKIPHLPAVQVPRQPNKYVPHIGAKQRAKGAK